MAKIKEFGERARGFWLDHYEDIVLGGIVFLLTALAFGLGYWYGTRSYQDAQISINCPSSFWKQ